MALAAINPTGQAAMTAGTTSTNVAIPTTGTPTQVLVQNLGNRAAFVLLGSTNTVAATVADGTPVLPNPDGGVVLTLGANTYLAAITSNGSAPLRITAGT